MDSPKRRRGRPAREYGPLVICTGCARKPKYRGNNLQPCECGGPGNPRWPRKMLT